jgi:hypothetical protein
VVRIHAGEPILFCTLEQAIERSKSEILGDVAEGTVPATCASYSELHDYVDANGYGGAFEHDFDNEETDFLERRAGCR